MCVNKLQYAAVNVMNHLLTPGMVQTFLYTSL